MPDQVWTYTELTAMLSDRLGAADLTLSLYSNNVTPSNASVYSDFTIALDPVTSAPLTWTLPAASWTYNDVTGGVVASQPQIAQIINGPLNLYGYFVYTAGNVLKYAQRFDSAPVALPSGTNAAILIPAVDGDSP